GDRLRAEAAAGREAVARATCDAALSALGAHRAFVLSAGKRVAPVSAVVATGESTQLQVPQELIDKVIGNRQVVTAETGGRALIAAPVHGPGAQRSGALQGDHVRAARGGRGRRGRGSRPLSLRPAHRGPDAPGRA